VRGIGCLLFVLVPILAYGLGAMVVNYGTSRGWPIPAAWLGPPRFAPPAQNIPVISEFVTLLLEQNNLTANLIFMVGISVILFGIISIIYGYIHSISAPSQYGPQDVPPPRVKTRKYRR
jgi:hypothetical protein